jgi:hypothetical protein
VAGAITATRVAAGLGLLLTTSFPSAATGPCQHLGVPTYFLPGSNWDAVSSASSAVRYLILNPASGPGTHREPSYAEAVRLAQARGISVLGYVDTDYGGRPASVVEEEIDRHRRWYGVNGVFLDRAASTSRELDYYAELARFVRSVPRSVVAMNPGVYPDERYARLADLLVTFEGDFEAYRDMALPSWVQKYPPSLSWHLIYSSSEAQFPHALELARSRGAGTVYVTDRGLDNPWDVPASYWARETASVAATTSGCTSV